MWLCVGIRVCLSVLLFDVRQQRIATPTARAPGGTYTAAELTVDVRLCLLRGDVSLVITRRNGNWVRAQRAGDGPEAAGRTEPLAPGAGPALRAERGALPSAAIVPGEPEQPIAVPGAEILGWLCLTKVFRCVLVRELADACHVCQLFHKAASLGIISPQEEFCWVPWEADCDQ